MNMVASVDDDIAEIERGEFMSHQDKICNSGKQMTLGLGKKVDEDKYCSNDGFVPPSYSTASYQHYNTHTINSTNNDSRPPHIAKQRSSISVNPLSMRDTLADIADLVDSDSEEEEGTTTCDNKQMPSSQPSKTNRNSTGGPEHRPLVGGFAAAAYEAARLDHYKKKGKLVNGHLPRSGKA